MTLLPTDLRDPDIAFDPAWLSPAEADRLFAVLESAIAWQVHRIRLFGRQVDSPRLSCWIGDPGASYAYSGSRFEPHPWPAALLAIRARLRAELDVDFNSVLANLYRHGRDCMGWHSDDEVELGPQPMIASLSLGATRRFMLKPKPLRGRSNANPAPTGFGLELPAGSLLLMQGQSQRRYRHALPRTAKSIGPRINLTFRHILGAKAMSVASI